MTYKKFTTERLEIRPTREEDAPFIFELMNSPKWLMFIGDRKIYSVEIARNYIKNRMLPQLEKLGFSNYTVIRKSDNVKIGTCGLYDRNGLDGLDIGFAFLPQFEKKGYAFESAFKLKSVAFEIFGIEEILAITKTTNISSQNLLKRLGLKFNSKVRLPNDDEELLLFRLKKGG